MAMALRQLLAYHCTQMLDMERGILQMNNQMASEVQNPTLKNKFVQHRGTTEQQIRNLEQVLTRLGGPSQQASQSSGIMEKVTEMVSGGDNVGTPVTKAMMEEHQKFLSTNPQQGLIDVEDALEGDKVEHMEIAAYTGLIALAGELGEGEIAQMLTQNLQGEQGMRSSIEQDLPTLLRDTGNQGRMAA